jgi:hypothetical protein
MNIYTGDKTPQNPKEGDLHINTGFSEVDEQLARIIKENEAS